jgi:uncharacterized membrane protein YdfJ with MMPL/SSD domain
MLRSITSFSARRPLLVVALWLAIVATGFTVGIGVFELIVNRFREERARDPDVPDAIARTGASAGRTVFSPA